jgi:TonB family protein
MHSGKLALTLAILGSQAVRADLTIRYQIEVTSGPAIPAAVVEMVKAQLAGVLPGEMVMQIKGGKCAGSFGSLSSIVDTGKDEITLFNPATKQFATVPAAGYADRVLAQQQLPAASQQALQAALQNMKIGLEIKKTGATSTIRGIQTEDNLLIFSMSMPNPAGLPIGLRLEMHEWLAGPEESTQAPALKEIAGCSANPGASADPSAIIERVLGPVGGANGLGDAAKQLTALKGKFALKTELELFAPGIVAILLAQGGQGLPANVDVNAALVKLDFNLAELSTDTVPDAAFQVPSGYQEASLEDLLKTIPKPGLAQAQPQAPAAAPPIEDFKGPAYRPGGGVTNPVVVYKPEPKYTEEARHAKIQGAVLISLVVDENGVARNVKVVRSLDPGLDQSAINTVRQWKFKPGQKDGNPVAVAAQIEVTFRLLDKPPDQQ